MAGDPAAPGAEGAAFRDGLSIDRSLEFGGRPELGGGPDGAPGPGTGTPGTCDGVPSAAGRERRPGDGAAPRFRVLHTSGDQ